MKKIIVTNPKAIKFLEDIKRKNEEVRKKMASRLEKHAEEIRKELKINENGK